MSMLKYTIEDVATLGRAQMSPGTLSDKLWGVLSHSVVAHARVDSCDRETGEYRVVLQGTLDLEPPDTTTTE
jgi:hypothetical protein